MFAISPTSSISKERAFWFGHDHPVDQATQNSKRLNAFAYFRKCDVEPCHLIPVEFSKFWMKAWWG